MEPVENSKKITTPLQRKHCHQIAKIIYLIDTLLAIFCYNYSHYYGSIATFSLIAVTILMPIGALTEKRRKYEAERKVG